jgi:Ca2+-binding EF-hand superfamily protein
MKTLSGWIPGPLALSLSLLTPALANAQVKTKPLWIAFDNYDQQRSRAAFKACDQDGDDRLSVVEARRCLSGIGSPDNLAGFQSIDRNRDGFLHWSEFDTQFKTITSRGSSFRFLPTRPFRDPSAESKTNDKKVPQQRRAAELVIAMANVDDDPHINRSEFLGLLKALNQPASLASSFDVVDLDKSGGLSQAEFVPILDAVPYLAQLVLAQSSGDKDQVRTSDLGKRLSTLHASLQRWHQVVFREADRNRDGVLDKAELKTTKAPPRQPVPTPRPDKRPGTPKPNK